MRKVRPQDIKRDFDQLARDRLDHFSRIERLLAGTPHEMRDLSTLAETTLHGVYVAFECFVSDLLLAYMNRDFSQYQATIQHRLNSSVREKFGAWTLTRTSFTPVKHVSIDQIESILDPDSFNLTFKNVSVLQQKANEWVTPALRAGITGISDSDRRLVDTVHAIRNFIAHQSTNAKQIMNAALANVVVGPGCPNVHLGRGAHEVHSVGAFLKASPAGQRRVVRFVERLRNAAAAL